MIKVSYEEIYTTSFEVSNKLTSEKVALLADLECYLAENYRFEESASIEDVVSDVDGMLQDWTERGADPMHFGMFRPKIDEASVVAEKIVARIDPNLATWQYASGANEIERHTLAQVAQFFGPAFVNGGAHFTSGGQESNHTAVIAALAKQFPQFSLQGLRGLPGQPVFYLSAEGHHSFDKIASTTGVGRSALRRVCCNDNFQMDCDKLSEQIEIDRTNGFVPFMVIGTAGTTGTGAIDPLNEMAEIAREQKLWFHVDGAWGGAVALSNRLRPILDGIEQADSITCDAHKLMSVPVGAGMFFCAHPAAARKVFAVETPYLPVGANDPYQSTMQWSRRFIGLKVFMMLAARGIPEIARRIEHQIEMGRLLRERLQASGWKILNDTPLPIVCFSDESFDCDASIAERLVARLHESESAWLSTTKVHGVTALRACVTNYETNPQHVERLVELLRICVSAPL